MCDLPFKPNLYMVNDQAQVMNAVVVNEEGVLQGHTVCVMCRGKRRVCCHGAKNLRPDAHLSFNLSVPHFLLWDRSSYRAYCLL